MTREYRVVDRVIAVRNFVGTMRREIEPTVLHTYTLENETGSRVFPGRSRKCPNCKEIIFFGYCGCDDEAAANGLRK